MAFIDPMFYGYASTDPGLAEAMTRWLYEDPANPIFDKPSLWPKGPRVQYVNRTESFLNVPFTPGTNEISRNVLLTGGKNAIVLSRAAVVREAGGATTRQLANEASSFIQYEEKIDFGSVSVFNSRVSAVFGTVPAIPYVNPDTDFWYGRMPRQITVTNDFSVEVDIFLSWLVAVIDTGR